MKDAFGVEKSDAGTASALGVLPFAGSAYQAKKAKKGRKAANYWRATGRKWAEQTGTAGTLGAAGGAATAITKNPMYANAALNSAFVVGRGAKAHAGYKSYKSAEKRGDIPKGK